jgi:ribosomal protein L11 methyltransferase
MKTEHSAGGAILTLAVSQSDAESISDWIAEHLEKTVVELKTPGGKDALLEVYFDNTLEAEVAAKAMDCFPNFGKSIREYAAEEWTESWKKHFKPMEVGQRLRVCPPWLARSEKTSKDSECRTGSMSRTGKLNEVVINPGLSFGTGNHFTTRFCLEQLDRLVPESGAKTMADIGTGSGILAIAAVKLGVTCAVGADFDPLCIEQAALNAQANGVAGQTEFFQHDIADGFPDERFDIVCANIYSSLLIDHASTLLRITGKYLLLTGIREVEVDGVADTFVRLGGRETVRDCNGEWSGLVIAR